MKYKINIGLPEKFVEFYVDTKNRILCDINIIDDRVFNMVFDKAFTYNFFEQFIIKYTNCKRSLDDNLKLILYYSNGMNFQSGFAPTLKISVYLPTCLVILNSREAN